MEGVISGRCDHMCAARMLTPSRLAAADAEIGLSVTARFSSTLSDSDSAVWHKINRNKTKKLPASNGSRLMHAQNDWMDIFENSAVNKIAPFDSEIVKSTSKYGEMKTVFTEARAYGAHIVGDAWISFVDLFFTVAFYYRIDSPFYAYDCICRIPIRSSLPFIFIFSMVLLWF